MNEEQPGSLIMQDNWGALKQYTAARIALGRTGVSVPATEVLQFKMAHAHAKDAVFSVMDKEFLIEELKQFNLPVVSLKSKALNRLEYLQRPDLGRRISDESLSALQPFTVNKYKICIIIADGLSAEAINKHALPLLALLLQKLTGQNITIAPLCVVEQGRVAVSDEIGFILNASATIVLIGERPGLSAADSLGVYITHNPKIGLTDEKRKCVSNIRKEGMSYEEAAQKIISHETLHLNEQAQ